MKINRACSGGSNELSTTSYCLKLFENKSDSAPYQDVAGNSNRDSIPAQKLMNFLKVRRGPVVTLRVPATTKTNTIDLLLFNSWITIDFLLQVVAAGSLLEFAFGEISLPVGRIQYFYLHPMTFYEYLLAMGKEQMAEHTLKQPDDVAGSIQEIMLNELRIYFFVGGMPECVKTYRDSGSMVETFQVQSEILDSYRDNFSK